MKRLLESRTEVVFADERARYELLARAIGEDALCVVLLEHVLSGGHVVETRMSTIATQRRPDNDAQAALDRLLVANRDQAREMASARIARR